MTKQKTELFDLAIVGGGPAGMLAALALSKETPYRIAHLAEEPRRDNRTSALMTPSITMLERLGLWGALEPHSAPLKIMRLVDDTKRLLRTPTINFDAGEVQDAPFGWNIPNAALIDEVEKHLQGSEKYQFFAGSCSVKSVDEEGVTLFSGDRHVRARYVIAADGRGSKTREAAGIFAKWFEHSQVALTTILSHEKSHSFVSTEFHRPSGPFTLVPMPGMKSSLVWVETPDEAARIMALSPEAQRNMIFSLSKGILGNITLETPLFAFPLSSMQVSSYAQSRTFLIGETAHVFPPIGAQGLNLTMRDIASLVDIFKISDDVDELEKAYNKARKADTWARTWGVNLLNYSLILPYAPIQLGRFAGMAALANVGALRRQAMRLGIAPSNLPSLMQAEST